MDISAPNYLPELAIKMYRLNKNKVVRGIAKSSFGLIFLIGSLSCGDGVINSYDSLTDEWTLMGLEGEDVRAIAVSKEDRNVIYAGSGSNFSDGVKGKLFRSKNAGTDWDTLLYNITVTDIKTTSAKAGLVYAALGITNFTLPGVIKSVDGGDSWEEISQGIPLDSEKGVGQLAIDPIDPQIIYAGTGGFGGGSLYKTINGGDSWDDIGKDIPDANLWSVAVVPSDPKTVYLGTIFIGGVFKSTDAGLTWKSTELWEVGAISDIAIDPNDHDRIVASGAIGPSASTFISADAGATWNLLGDKQPGASIVIDELYSNIYTGSGFGIFKYDEGSDNWIDFNQGLGDTLTRVRELEYIGSSEILLAGTVKGIYGRKLNVEE